jgi:hypothetical protein
MTTIPPGTAIPIRTNQGINVRDTTDGRIYTGVVDRDVRDPNGNLAIPRGSNAELMVREVGRHDLALDLESITVNGRRYAVASSNVARTDERSGAGRTGKFVGGGALLGTIVGAIAGGGRGAAVGAVAGAAGGAGAAVATRGGTVHVPPESILTFRLEQPLMVDTADPGYYRDGRHYHNY